MVNKFTAVIGMDFEEGEGEGRVNILHSVKAPLLSLVEKRAKFEPTGEGVGSGEGEVKLTGIMVAAVVDGVNLEEAGPLFLLGIAGADGNLLYKA
jgi:hypothetical protein